MIDVIKNMLKRNNLGTRKEKFFKKTLKEEQNAWLLEDKYSLKSLWLLINGMKEEHISFFNKTDPILFLKSTGRLASSLHQLKRSHIVIIYPEILKMMKSFQFEKAAAVLAHELGHLYYGHSKKQLSPLQAQVQADHFALDVGLGKELQEVLLENSNFEECRVRVAYLTSKLIKEENFFESSEENNS